MGPRLSNHETSVRKILGKYLVWKSDWKQTSGNQCFLKPFEARNSKLIQYKYYNIHDLPSTIRDCCEWSLSFYEQIWVINFMTMRCWCAGITRKRWAASPSSLKGWIQVLCIRGSWILTAYYPFYHPQWGRPQSLAKRLEYTINKQLTDFFFTDFFSQKTKSTAWITSNQKAKKLTTFALVRKASTYASETVHHITSWSSASWRVWVFLVLYHKPWILMSINDIYSTIMPIDSRFLYLPLHMLSRQLFSARHHGKMDVVMARFWQPRTFIAVSHQDASCRKDFLI